MQSLTSATVCCVLCSKVNFADTPADNLVNAVLGSCHIADPTPPPPTLPPTDLTTRPPATIPTGTLALSCDTITCSKANPFGKYQFFCERNFYSFFCHEVARKCQQFLFSSRTIFNCNVCYFSFSSVALVFRFLFIICYLQNDLSSSKFMTLNSL